MRDLGLTVEFELAAHFKINMNKRFLFIVFVLQSLCLCGQVSITIGGQIVEYASGHLLDGVNITVSKDSTILSNYIVSDRSGLFSITVPTFGEYQLAYRRSGYLPTHVTLEIDSSNAASYSNIFLTLERLPGYLFEGTIRELLTDVIPKRLGKELTNIKIEVYNNSTNQEEVIVEDNPDNTFEVNFERGNHYTMLLRKKGFYARRIEVYVNVNGCILCFEGLGGNYHPNIEDALTGENSRGSLVTDIPLRPIRVDEIIQLDDIYYDYDKWTIREDARPALDKLVSIMRRNPIEIELRSHTDSRGEDSYNQKLSDNRAISAVEYIISKGIKSGRIKAKGYGETILLNNCDDGVKCSEAEHQLNRRTEFKVLRVIEDSNFDNKSLFDIIQEERINKRRLIEKVNN